MKKQRIRKITAAVLSGALLLGTFPGQSVLAAEPGSEAAKLQIAGEEKPAESSKVEAQVIEDAEELAEIAGESLPEDGYARAVIDTEQASVTTDGEQADFGETFDADPREVPDLSSVSEVKAYFQDQPQEVVSVDDGQVTVEDPYQTKQILIFTDALTEDYGAGEVYYEPDLQEYILTYATEEETKAAYEKYQEEFGDKCMLNEIFSQEELLLDAEEDGLCGNSLQKAEEEDSSEIALMAEEESTGYSAVSWGTTYMGLDTLKNQASSEELPEITVAVIDTGIDAENPMFEGRTITDSSWNLCDDNTDLYDENSLGHGTHVAGIIADATPENVNLMILKIFDEDHANSSTMLLQAAVKYAVDGGADVINMSLGMQYEDGETYIPWMESQIAYATEHNVPIVNAAGNASLNVSTCYPACNSETLAISAIDNKENFSSEKAKSNYGEGVDFCAPGASIRSAAKGTGTKLLSGTSMAAPHITAAIAYIKMRYPEADNATVFSILKQYAKDLGDTGKDIYYGYGSVILGSFFEDSEEPALIDLAEIDGTYISPLVFTYDGTAKEPVVYMGGISSDSYEVTYSDNVAPGTGHVTVTGKGNYTGSCEFDFAITVPDTTIEKLSAMSSGIRIYWTALDCADGYSIYRRKNGDSAWTLVKTCMKGTTSYWTDSGASNGVLYTYKVIATFSCDGEKYVCNPSGTLSSCYLSRNRVTSLSQLSGRRLKVKWSKNSKATKYQIEYSTSITYKKAVRKTRKASSGTSCTITGLSKGTYYVRVRSQKTLQGKNYYAAWSTSMKIRIR